MKRENWYGYNIGKIIKITFKIKKNKYSFMLVKTP